MKKKQDVHRKAIDNMKLEILNEIGIDIEKTKIKKYDFEFIEKRLETFRQK